MKTLMKRLIAQKSHSYGTRQLVAGDEYEASRIHSRVLVAAKIARYAPEQPERPPMVTMTVTRGTTPATPTNTAGEPGTATADPETTAPITKVPPQQRASKPLVSPREPRR
jgi:hypothetical protein